MFAQNLDRVFNRNRKDLHCVHRRYHLDDFAHQAELAAFVISSFRRRAGI